MNNKSIVAQSSASNAEKGEAFFFILLSSLIVSSERSAVKPIHRCPACYPMIAASINNLFIFYENRMPGWEERLGRKRGINIVNWLRTLPEDDFYSFAPALVNADKFPFDLG